MDIDEFYAIGNEYGLKVIEYACNEPHMWFTEFYPDSNKYDTTGCELCAFNTSMDGVQYVVCWTHHISDAGELIQSGSFTIMPNTNDTQVLSEHLKRQLNIFSKYKRLRRKKKIDTI